MAVNGASNAPSPYVDGLADALAPNEVAPKYRDSGVARSEQPIHFLLGNSPDMQGNSVSEASLAHYLIQVFQDVGVVSRACSNSRELRAACGGSGIWL